MRDQGSTVVVVTHDLNLAIRYSDRILVIADHQLALHGPPCEVIGQLEPIFGLPIHHGNLDNGHSWVVPG